MVLVVGALVMVDAAYHDIASDSLADHDARYCGFAAESDPKGKMMRAAGAQVPASVSVGSALSRRAKKSVSSHENISALMQRQLSIWKWSSRVSSSLHIRPVSLSRVNAVLFEQKLG